MSLSNLLRPAGLLAGLALMLSSAAVNPLSAAILYNFTGTCDTGCTGTASAQLVLVDSFVPGSAISGVSEFISFTYYGTGGAPIFTITTTPTTFSGTLPAVSGPAVVDFLISDGAGLVFTSQASGGWGWALNSVIQDLGSSGNFVVQTPEPGSLLLIGAGLAALEARRSSKRA